MLGSLRVVQVAESTLLLWRLKKGWSPWLAMWKGGLLPQNSIACMFLKIILKPAISFLNSSPVQSMSIHLWHLKLVPSFPSCEGDVLRLVAHLKSESHKHPWRNPSLKFCNFFTSCNFESKCLPALPFTVRSNLKCLSGNIIFQDSPAQCPVSHTIGLWSWDRHSEKCYNSGSLVVGQVAEITLL